MLLGNNEAGSMIPYVKRAHELGMKVVLTNPNEVIWYKNRSWIYLPPGVDYKKFKYIPGILPH